MPRAADEEGQAAYGGIRHDRLKRPEPRQQPRGAGGDGEEEMRSATIILVTVVACAVCVAAATARHAAAAQPFLWGAATSSYQVEGGLTNNDYDLFNRSADVADRVRNNTGLGGPAANLAPAGEATRSWQPAYYRRDFDNARMLGMNSMRISLEWSRIEPQSGTWNDAALDAYARILSAMRARGIRPVVSLNHFTLPLWALTPPTTTIGCFIVLKCPNDNDPAFLGSLRGWESPQLVDEFDRFVRHVVPRLANLVDYWITLNEPVSSIIGVGYIGGVWSPGFVTDGIRGKAVLHNLIVAHVRAYRAIHDLDHSDADGDGVAATVGVAHAMLFATPAPGSDAEAARNLDYFFNDYFLNAIVNGEEDVHYLNSSPCCTPQDRSSPEFIIHPEWRNAVDFIGINYYRRAWVFHDNLLALTTARYMGGRFDNNLYGHFEIPHSLLNDLGWEIYPRGLYDLLVRIKERWNKPVLITENGIAERADRNRAAFLVAYVRQLSAARQAGVDVLGYLYWSLLDNWELHENYRREAQFGLFHVERDPNNPQRCLGPCHRFLTEGALAYRQIIAESLRTDSNGAPTAAAVASADRRFGSFNDDGSVVRPPTQTFAREWQGRTSRSAQFELLLMRTDAKPTWLPLIYWHNLAAWHAMTVQRVGSVRVLRETWYDGAGHRWRVRDHRFASSGNSLRGSYREGTRTVTWRATRVRAAGLWRWQGSSPSGGSLFAVTDYEGRYLGKFLTLPTPSHGQSWREIPTVAVTPANGTTLTLDANELFHLALQLTTPDSATTLAERSGNWIGLKVRVLLPTRFGYTGFGLSSGELVWRGLQADGAAFEVSEAQPIFRAFPTREMDQQHKEHDETAVFGRTFTFEPLDVTFGVVTRARISWEAAGRHYETIATATGCLLENVQCEGTWNDVAGYRAERVPDQMPAFP